MSSAYEVIKGLRAVRSFSPQPIDSELLMAILEAGRWTGSSRNSQPWELVVVLEQQAREELSGCGRYAEPLAAAAAAVVLVGRPKASDFDIGRLGQNLMLAAATFGLGSCPVTLHNQDRARRLLGVPSDHLCGYAVALGYVADTRHRRTWIPRGRRPLADVVHLERFGTESAR